MIGTQIGAQGERVSAASHSAPSLSLLAQMHFDSDNEGVGEVRDPVILYAQNA